MTMVEYIIPFWFAFVRLQLDIQASIDRTPFFIYCFIVSIIKEATAVFLYFIFVTHSCLLFTAFRTMNTFE